MEKSSSTTVAINPHHTVLGAENAILAGTNRRYHVPDYEGCLSVKSVVAGSATWETGGRRFVVHENSYLILNDRQRYTITIDAAREVTTFCLFFKRGLVEDVFRSYAAPAAALLDAPAEPGAARLNFWEKLETEGGGVLGRVRELRRQVVGGVASRAALEPYFYAVADRMVWEHLEVCAAVRRLSSLRASTRLELYRRLLRGRDYILSSLCEPILLDDIAREACLSPYHFHRTFSQVFHETPHRYLTRHRLERACHLLRQTDRSVTEVCFECGFESLGSFSSLFRRRFGVSPRAFRAARTRNSQD
jgi:AraC family transcriptional regulator